MIQLISWTKKILNIKSNNELKKLFIMSLCLFITIGTYTIVRELKDAIFYLIVGKSFFPDVKTLSYFFMIPLVLFYTWLSGKIRKHNLLIFYCLVYGIGGCITAIFLSNPEIGLYNLTSSGNRLFGWIYYIFLEGYSPFIVSLMWAFFNSSSKPNDIKKNYIIATMFSKFGGILTSYFAWIFMSKQFIYLHSFSDVQCYVWLTVITFGIILLMPILILYLVKTVPEHELYGYTDEIEHNTINDNNKKKSSSFGLSELIKSPYVIGMFGMVFFWEVVNVIFNFMRLNIGFDCSDGIADFSAFLFKNIMYSHIIGLVIVVFGTSFFINIFGEKISLIMIPISTGLAISSCLLYPTPEMVLFVYSFISALNYSFARPLREALYIPTSKDIQFKTKSWIDGFGSKFSKGIGSIYNKIVINLSSSSSNLIHSMFFSIVIILWIILTYFLGKKWEDAIKKKEIIK